MDVHFQFGHEEGLDYPFRQTCGRWHAQCWFQKCKLSRVGPYARKILYLRFGIPPDWAWNALTGPRHSAFNPISPPLLEADSPSVVVVAELKTARRTDFVRRASINLARQFGEIRKTADRADKRCRHSRILLMGQVLRVVVRNIPMGSAA